MSDSHFDHIVRIVEYKCAVSLPIQQIDNTLDLPIRVTASGHEFV